MIKVKNFRFRIDKEINEIEIINKKLDKGFYIKEMLFDVDSNWTGEKVISLKFNKDNALFDEESVEYYPYPSFYQKVDVAYNKEERFIININNNDDIEHFIYIHLICEEIRK